MNNYLLTASCLLLVYTGFGQSAIEPSITTTDPIFVQGVIGFQNIITVTNVSAEAASVWLCPLNLAGELLPDSVPAVFNGTDWVNTLDMGDMDSNAVRLEAHSYDASNTFLETSPHYGFTVKPLPASMQSGWVNIVADSISDAGIAYLTFSINVPDSTQPIDPDIVGVGGKKFGLEKNSIVLERTYDLASGDINGTGSSYQYQFNAFDRPVLAGQIALDTSADLSIDIDNNFNPVIEGHFSAQKDLFTFVTTDATLPLPINPASISIGASLTALGGFAADCYLGLDPGTGQFGFIQKPSGERSNVSLGAKMTGEVHVTGSLLNRHIAGIQASLAATVRIGISYEFQTVPAWQDSFLLGGDLIITGDVKLTGLVGSAKEWWCSHSPFSNCEPDNTILNGVIWPRNNNDNPMSFGSALPASLDSLFHVFLQNHNAYARSVLSDSGVAFPAPDATPQPAFANRGSTVATVWIEADSLGAHLLFSTLDINLNKFALTTEVASNGVMLADPKLAIAPDGSTIIVWTESKLQVIDIENNPEFGVDTLLNSLEVWYAVYDPVSASVTAKSRIDNPEGLPASKPGIAISDSGKAILTWLAEDSGSSATNIWYATLIDGNGIWYQSTPAIINDLPGNNYGVNVCFTDSVNAVAVWITDPDANDSSGGNQIVASYYNGTVWGASTSISDENDNEQFHDLSMDFNGDFGALAYTSTTYDEDENQVNSIKVEFFKNGAWDANNYYEYDDSAKYVNMPRVSISDREFAAVSYQTINMYEDSTGEVDAGEVNLVLKDLNSSNDWQKLNFSTDIAQDTSIYVWDMDVVLGKNNTLYSLSQEEDTIDYSLVGGHYSPRIGTLFGDPSLSMVLRGLTVNDDLSVTADSTNALPETPSGIRQIAESVPGLSLLAYPNPFKSKLTVEYNISDSKSTSIEIFDLLGQRVNTILNYSRPITGRNKVTSDLNGLSPGIYILKLASNQQMQTVKLVKQ